MAVVHALDDTEVEVLSLAMRHPIFCGDGAAVTPTIERLATLGYLVLKKDDHWHATLSGALRMRDPDRLRGMRETPRARA